MRVLRRRVDVEQTEARIDAVLAELRPMLRMNDCGLAIDRFDPETGDLQLGIDGGCPDCGVSVQTFIHAIETRIRQSVTEVRTVRAIVRDGTPDQRRHA